MTKKRIAVFDLDGTLVETDAANNAAYLWALTRAGVVGMSGASGRISANMIRSATRLSVGEMDDIVCTKARAYCRELWRTRLGPAASTLRYVLVNRSAYEKVVLLTDSVERRAMETLTFYGLVDYFDEIVCNGGIGDKYLNYFNSYDADPNVCVVWENEDRKVLAAIAAGVNAENIRKVA